MCAIMRLINNKTDELTEIQGFSKDEILEIKRNVNSLQTKEDDEELTKYLQSKFPYELLESFSKYIKRITKFLNRFFFTLKEQNLKEEFYYFKNSIFNELNGISKNLINLKVNCQNVLRMLKSNKTLNNYKNAINDNIQKSNELKDNLESIKNIEPKSYKNSTYLWREINNIKNLQYNINEYPEEFNEWNDIVEIFKHLALNNNKISTKKWEKRKLENLNFDFKELSSLLSKHQKENFDFYSDLMYLLNLNDIYSILDDQEFVNVLGRKEIKAELRRFLQNIIKKLIKNEIDENLKEFKALNNQYNLLNKELEFNNLENLLNQKISIFLPNFVEYYYKGLEIKYQEELERIDRPEEIDKVLDEYRETNNELYQKFRSIKQSINFYEQFVKPYQDIFISLRKIFDTILEDIARKEEEFTFYLKTLKTEKLQDNLRVYINNRIDDLDLVVENYRDETKKILEREFPQFNQIKEKLINYKDKIQKIKDGVYTKLREREDKDLNRFNIIKKWEDHFTLKQQQVGFLLSKFLTKFYSEFEDLIDKEQSIFGDLSEITHAQDGIDNVSLNYDLNHFLAEKLTEKELKNRIIELKAKLNHIDQLHNVYEMELEDLEKSLTKKVQIREGISTSEIQCGICRKQINLADDKIIKCAFCGAVFHYLCVAFWLSEYNSCPSCQNVFLEPGSQLFELNED
ncbi:MAG: hypothetical protein GF317_24640 [Candidatus Lokiarchaeota archaeon]|nr:hypothetical protein [Candidatus Lokiarchaeota archaeon]MBD3202552.1 hypothetical protein [Candidatus Lokiarchaeota archaeon]